MPSETARAQRIAGPMLNPRKPASPKEVDAALRKAGIVAIVRREWVNEARRRNRFQSSEAARGDDYRAIQKALADGRTRRQQEALAAHIRNEEVMAERQYGKPPPPAKSKPKTTASALYDTFWGFNANYDIFSRLLEMAGWSKPQGSWWR